MDLLTRLAVIQENTSTCVCPTETPPPLTPSRGSHQCLKQSQAIPWKGLVGVLKLKDLTAPRRAPAPATRLEPCGHPMAVRVRHFE